MRKVIISTVGTSLPTNQINRSASTEENWYNQLLDTANLRREQVPQETLDIIETAKGLAKDIFNTGD
jgi:hypothetical protein